MGRSQMFCLFVLPGVMSTLVLFLMWNYRSGQYRISTGLPYQYEVPSFMRRTNVPPLRFRYHLQPAERGPRFVESVGTSGHVSIRVFVRSVPRERALRDAARDTWVSALKKLNFSVIFVVGEPSKNDSGSETATVQKALKKEHEEKGDMLQGNFEDTYQTGSLKLASIVQWQASQELQQDSVRFLNVFLDRDTVVYPRGLLELLRESGIAEKNHAIVGKCHNWRYLVVREPRNKWFVNESVWPSKDYPPFCLGFGYILSDGAMRDIATFLDSLDPSWLAAFQNDDVLFTGVFPLHSRPQYSRSNQPHILSFLANTLLPSRPPPPHLAMEHLHKTTKITGRSFATSKLVRLKWDLYLQSLGSQSH